MDLGTFSISLAVKDIHASKAFYNALGFHEDENCQTIEQNWLILRNGDTTIGLFQGMFEKNMLTFNPGWNNQAKEIDDFDDVREIQKKLKAAGIKLEMEADESTTGPAHISLTDPDGNPILIDQHR